MGRGEKYTGWVWHAIGRRQCSQGIVTFANGLNRGGFRRCGYSFVFRQCVVVSRQVRVTVTICVIICDGCILDCRGQGGSPASDRFYCRVTCWDSGGILSGG